MSTEREEAKSPMACAVCAEVLFPRAEGGQVVSWLHRAELVDVWGEVEGTDLAKVAQVKERLGHGPVDHVAIPVPREQVRAETRCDFCSQPSPGWVLPVEEFEASANHGSTKDWEACDVCARLIRKGRWEQLVKRAVLEMASRHGLSPAEPSLVDGMKALFSQVREYQTGPVRRIER